MMIDISERIKMVFKTLLQRTSHWFSKSVNGTYITNGKNKEMGQKLFVNSINC
jgi:hypothetical protein